MRTPSSNRKEILAELVPILEHYCAGVEYHLTPNEWKEISYKFKLSENFIREYQNCIYWDYIVLYQNISLDFIKEFRHKIQDDVLDYRFGRISKLKYGR